MTIGELFQRAKERYSELDAACNSMYVPEAVEQSTAYLEAAARLAETNVWLDLIGGVVADEIEDRHETVLDRNRTLLDPEVTGHVQRKVNRHLNPDFPDEAGLLT